MAEAADAVIKATTGSEAIPGLDLKGLIAQFSATQAAIAKSKEELAQEQVNIKNATEREIAANTGAAELAGQAATLVGNIAIKNAERNARTAAEFGTNPDAQSYVMSALAEQSIRLTREIEQSGTEFAEKVKIGPTDDLFQWVTNQFSLPREAAAHNAKVKQRELITDTIDKLQVQATRQSVINSTIDANTTATILQLNSERELKSATITNEKARIAASQVNAQLISVRTALDEKTLQNVVTLNESQFKVEQLKLQRAANAISAGHLSIAQQNLTMHQQQMKLQIEMRSEQQADKDRFNDKLARASKFLGFGTVLTIEEFKAMTGPVRQKLEFAMTNADIQEGRYGPTPSQAVDVITGLQANLPRSQQMILAKLNEDFSRAITGGATGTGSMASVQAFKMMPPEEQMRVKDKEVAKSVLQELKAIPNSGGYFSLPPMLAMGKIAGVAETRLWKEFISPLAKNPQTAMDAGMIVGIARKAVVEGKMSPFEAASNLAKIYNLGVQDNLFNNNYSKLGISIPAQFLQDGKLIYRANIPTGGVFGTSFGSQSENWIMNDATFIANKLLLDQARAKSIFDPEKPFGKLLNLNSPPP